MTGEVVLLMGPPGAGKTTWTRGRYRAHQVVSLDTFRRQLTDDTADQTVNPIAVELRRIVLEQRLMRGLPTVVDSTNVVFGHRAPITALARHWGRPTIAVVFHASLEVCLQRQESHERTRQRPGQPHGRKVPPEVITQMWSDLARVWNTMSREVDCTVHVSPEGLGQQVRIGDIPARAGERLDWLAELPAVPGVGQLPWASPYAAAGVGR